LMEIMEMLLRERRSLVCESELFVGALIIGVT